MSSASRLKALLQTISPSANTRTIGNLKLGGVTFPVSSANDPTRLPYLSNEDLLDWRDQEGYTNDNLEWLLKKYILGQDVFLVGEPGGLYSRRLIMTFCRLINAEFEHVALHRDIGETELKQARELRPPSTLSYIDSPAVRAVKHGRILILEGVEKAERGIMPLLNNLLENREMNLDDGTHILHPSRYALLDKASRAQKTEDGKERFIPANHRFRVFAIGAPVPPYKGYPLDPPFRSRFQARFIDPLKGSIAVERLGLSRSHNPFGIDSETFTSPQSPNGSINSTSKLHVGLRNVILAVNYAASESTRLDSSSGSLGGSGSAIPPFPQTALRKLALVMEAFPLPPAFSISDASSVNLAIPRHMLLLFLHPRMVDASSKAWETLNDLLMKEGIGKLAAGEKAGSELLTEIGQQRHEGTSTGGLGLMGYRVKSIERMPSAKGKNEAKIVFESALQHGSCVERLVPCGSLPIASFPSLTGYNADPSLKVTPRFLSLLTIALQLHSLSLDISYTPPSSNSTASCSTTSLIRTFAEVLGYELESVYMWKEMGGRELLMRRVVDEGEDIERGRGGTKWVASPLIQSAWEGRLVHIAGIDVIGPTAGSLARLVQDRESELWEGKRIVAHFSEKEEMTQANKESSDDSITCCHSSFRVIATASKSLPLRDWLTDEHANVFGALPSLPMSPSEELDILLETGCEKAIAMKILEFATSYRESLNASMKEKGSHGSRDGGSQKNRRLGTRALVRIARWYAKFPWEGDLYSLFARALLIEFLPVTERGNVENLLKECGIVKNLELYNPPPTRLPNGDLLFPEASDPYQKSQAVTIPGFNALQDVEGVASLVPHMDHFYNNSLQTGLMRDMAVDMEVLGEHLVLLGNQGVGKNKIVDRLCQLVGRPREYIQLHRDTTVNQLMFQTNLENGSIRYIDSPLLRGIKKGRVVIIDEADKAPEHVVAVLKSLGGQGELSLPDGRRVRRHRVREDDIEVHKNFRLVLLANRPGYPFLGNHFLQVLGDNFSCHAVPNPDARSEHRLLMQLAPELDEVTVRRLVASFHDLRKGFDEGRISYPYSLRELINLVKHMQVYPEDDLETSIRNVFDFDVYKRDTMRTLLDILEHHKLNVRRVGLEAVRNTSRKVKDISFEPTGSTDLDKPKFGKKDPKNEPHVGGNTWSGGSGGRDTAGLGGRGGYMRLFSGNKIHQVSQKLKDDVPEEVKARAREMAQKELERKLRELKMSAHDAKAYGLLLDAVQFHVASLVDLFENLAAKEQDRVWIKRQTDGELDDTRLTDGLTGESTVYKRRGVEKPEFGRPQLKPKRIRFLFDVSGSMYRFQYDGRLERSLEAVVMLMETFDRLSRKDKYVWDIVGHSGDGPRISFVEADQYPQNAGDRWRVTEKMNLTTQYAFSGDYTVEAIEKSVLEIAKYDADDWFVIAITDANFGRYEISLEDLKKVMNRDPRVNTALICIGESAEATWIPKNFPGRGFRVGNASEVPGVMKTILERVVDK